MCGFLTDIFTFKFKLPLSFLSIQKKYEQQLAGRV